MPPVPSPREAIQMLLVNAPIPVKPFSLPGLCQPVPQFSWKQLRRNSPCPHKVDKVNKKNKNLLNIKNKAATYNAN